VFAQLIGTMMLLEEDEKKMVKGLIVNKFRGDKSILEPGLKMLEDKSGVPVVGVAPFLSVELEDEDSLTERFDQNQEVGLIDIVVIRIPRISNFTDFNPFECMPGVSLRYVKHVGELKHPDMIILPGTKNTMEDLLWMRQNGLEAAVIKAAANGTVIFGVCGGYQMLGECLNDPDGVEAGGTIKGMGLIPMDTVFDAAKTRTRVTGTFAAVQGVLAGLDGIKLEGYEIHMGVTTLKQGAYSLAHITDLVQSGDSITDGAFAGNVYGTYVHGVFDKEAVAKAVVKALGDAKGIDTEDIAGVDYQEFKERQYDLLAEGLRGHLDMESVYRMLEEGV
jgi:adenosylcobyric acid synthase